MTEIHIVGTAHVSQKSIDEVREAVDTINPDVIAIELDPGRFAALKQQMKEAKDAADGTAPTPETHESPEIRDLLKGNFTLHPHACTVDSGLCPAQDRDERRD